MLICAWGGDDIEITEDAQTGWKKGWPCKTQCLVNQCHMANPLLLVKNDSTLYKIVICHVISSWFCLCRNKSARKQRSLVRGCWRERWHLPVAASQTQHISRGACSLGGMYFWMKQREHISIGQLPSLKLTYPLKIDPWKFGDAYGKSSFLGVSNEALASFPPWSPEVLTAGYLTTPRDSVIWGRNEPIVPQGEQLAGCCNFTIINNNVTLL